MKVMKTERKGQAALEYLVTYGWAILAIVIIAAVLWYLGVFNPGKYAAGKQSGGFSTVSVIDYTTIPGTGSGQVTISFGNAAGTTINSISAYMNQTSGNFVLVCSPATNVGANSQFQCTSNATSFATGDQLNIQLVYTSSTSNLQHTETGFVRAA